MIAPVSVHCFSITFCNLGFSRGKSEISGFLETFVACDLTDADILLSLLRYVNIEGQGNFLTFAKCHVQTKNK